MNARHAGRIVVAGMLVFLGFGRVSEANPPIADGSKADRAGDDQVAIIEHEAGQSQLIRGRRPSDSQRVIAHYFSDDLVSELVRDLKSEQENGWRAPSMERFRRRLVESSRVIDTRIFLSRLQSADLMSQVCQPSPIQESAMEVVLSIGLYRYSELLREIEQIQIPDGPDHPDEFQPRPQTGGAIGGTFSNFHSEEEREEYERNYELMKRRTQFKALDFQLKRELENTEREVKHLVRSIDSMCDPDGKRLLRAMIESANIPEANYSDLLDLPPNE